MPLTAIELCRGVLPMTNCADCGQPTCLSFAMRVVQDQTPLAECPHLEPQVLKERQDELDEQHKGGRWLKRDPVADAIKWAKERSASVALEDLPQRIGGQLKEGPRGPALELPYFEGLVLIDLQDISREDGAEVDHWEKVFLYNHLAQGGAAHPTGNWKGFEEFPNTVSKRSSILDHVEKPLQERFSGRVAAFTQAALALGGKKLPAGETSGDAAFTFQAFPRVPLMLTFHDTAEGESYQARFKLMYDQTVVEHLDIESIVFLSERLADLLAEHDDAASN